jgi:hypothetical protein
MVSGAFESAIPFAKVVVVETELGGLVLTGEAVGVGVAVGPGAVMIGALVDAPLQATSAAQAMTAKTP